MNVVLPLGDFFCEPEELGDHPGFASVNVRAFLEWLYPERKISASEVPALLERIADATAATKHRTKGYIWCPISVVTIPTVGDDEIWDDDIEILACGDPEQSAAARDRLPHGGEGRVVWGQQLEFLAVLDLDEHCV